MNLKELQANRIQKIKPSTLHCCETQRPECHRKSRALVTAAGFTPRSACSPVFRKSKATPKGRRAENQCRSCELPWLLRTALPLRQQRAQHQVWTRMQHRTIWGGGSGQEREAAWEGCASWRQKVIFSPFRTSRRLPVSSSSFSNPTVRAQLMNAPGTGEWYGNVN